MTRFRARTYGSADWTYIDIAEEEDGGAEDLLSGLVAGMLEQTSLHVQREDAEGGWENL